MNEMKSPIAAAVILKFFFEKLEKMTLSENVKKGDIRFSFLCLPRSHKQRASFFKGKKFIF